MSFSVDVKKELSQASLSCQNCKRAMLYGIFLFSRASHEHRILMHTENKHVADCYVDLLTELTGSIVTVFINDYVSQKKRRSYSVTVEHEQDIQGLYRMFCIEPDAPLALNSRLFKRDCCVQAFVRGAFLACGSVTDPNKEYHLEFSVPSLSLAEGLLSLLQEHGIPIKLASRKGIRLLYLKESEPIEDLLTYMGAVNNSLELMNVKIYKDVRNKVNRVTNCETANIEKTVNAAAGQVEAIRLIEQTLGLDELPEDLREVAGLRLENPDMSLRELCQSLVEPISRSGVNHRLKRLMAIADEIREKKKAGSER